MPPPNPLPVRAEDLVHLLTASLGRTQSSQLILERMRRLGVPAQMRPSDALAVLESLAADAGVVGTVARFAKARFILNQDV